MVTAAKKKAAKKGEPGKGVEAALEAEAKGRAAKAETVEGLKARVVELEAQLQAALNLFDAYGKKATLLGAEMQSQIVRR